MIEINQVVALGAKLLFHLAYDPRSSVSDRLYVGVRPETGPNRAFEKLPSGRFHPALDRAGVDRRSAPLGVRQRNLALSP